jgi:RNA polymerase sigma-70 factor (ECF subfamily)
VRSNGLARTNIKERLMETTADNSELLATFDTPVFEASDEALIAGVCAGDEESFEQLFERHKVRISRLAYRFFVRREQVEEILQETFSRAYFSLREFRGGHEFSFAAWLSRIAVRACYDELRKQRRRSESNLSDLTEDEAAFIGRRMHDEPVGGSVEEQMISRDLADKLLARLGPDDRMVLTLLNLKDQSIAEVAAMTGWSVGKVKMRALRARNSLRRVVGRYT